MRLLHLWLLLLLKDALAFLRLLLLLKGTLALLFLPLLELLLGLLSLTFLTVTAAFFLQSTLFSPTLHT
jgi:hypothetical protein